MNPSNFLSKNSSPKPSSSPTTLTMIGRAIRPGKLLWTLIKISWLKRGIKRNQKGNFSSSICKGNSIQISTSKMKRKKKDSLTLSNSTTLSSAYKLFQKNRVLQQNWLSILSMLATLAFWSVYLCKTGGQQLHATWWLILPPYCTCSWPWRMAKNFYQKSSQRKNY